MIATGQPIILHTGDTPTTVVAVVGLVLAALSFGWQAWSFSVSGSRVTVTVRAGVKRGPVVATLANAPTRTEINTLVRQGFNEPVYGVSLHNRGRGPTSVRSVDLLFNDGGAVGLTRVEPQLPHRLEGESDQTWYFDAELARNYVVSVSTVRPWPTGRTPMVRGRVQVGSRDGTVLSKNELPVAS